jgi:hypothetical protein
LDESKADRLTLEFILGCFHSLDESQRCSPYPELFSQLDESKRAKKTLELAIHKIKSKRVANILELISSTTLQTWIETKSKLSIRWARKDKRRLSPSRLLLI